MGYEYYWWSPMMKFLYIVCEGQSEQIFIDNLLIPYLYTKHPNNFSEYKISAPILRSPKARVQSNKGGDVRYVRIKNHIEHFITQTPNCYVTTFIDFYAIGNDFPSYGNLSHINGAIAQAHALENDLQQIDYRVIPYIQLHEYETIYFADITGFVATDNKLEQISQKMNDILVQFNNQPEQINNNPTTAPSKRIHNIFASQLLNYKDAKTLYARLYSADADYVSKIDLIRNLCPNFNNWINWLLGL